MLFVSQVQRYTNDSKIHKNEFNDPVSFSLVFFSLINYYFTWTIISYEVYFLIKLSKSMRVM